MRRAILFVLVVSVATRQADGRVYYLENVDGPRNNDAILEQSSRDLDLAFSAGEPFVENENVVSPTRKVSVNNLASRTLVSIRRSLTLRSTPARHWVSTRLLPNCNVR